MKIDRYYGTRLDQQVDLRVHPVDAIRMLIDHTAIDPLHPESEQPTVVFTKSHSDNTTGQKMDDVNFAPPSATDMGSDDWHQVDFSRGTYISWTDLRRGFRDTIRSADYRDEQLTDGPESQAGLFSQVGFKWIGTDGNRTPNTDGESCDLSAQDPEDPNFSFARIERTIVPQPQDSICSGCEPAGYYSDEGTTLHTYRVNPFLVTAVGLTSGESSSCGGGGAPCSPAIAVTLDAGGYSLGLTRQQMDSCGIPVFGLRIYRGVAPGIYEFVADIGQSGSWKDFQVKRGVTYRYVARAYDRDGTLGPQSAEVVVTIIDTIAPPPVANVTAVPASRKILVSWNPWQDGDTQKVFVYMALSPGGQRYLMNGAGTGWGTSTFAITSLLAGQAYYITLTAVDAVGNESSPSTELAVTPTP